MSEKGTLEWLMEFPPDVKRLLEWYLTRNDETYHFTMKCGGTNEVIQETCLHLLSLQRKFAVLPARWTTVCINQAKWCMSRMWQQRKRQLITDEDLVWAEAKVPKCGYTVDAETIADHSMLEQVFEAVLKSLTYREREILKLRYGFGDGYAYTLEEVGRIFKTTRERIRQIESKGLRKLQHPLRACRLRSFAKDRGMCYEGIYDDFDDYDEKIRLEALYGRRPLPGYLRRNIDRTNRTAH